MDSSRCCVSCGMAGGGGWELPRSCVRPVPQPDKPHSEKSGTPAQTARGRRYTAWGRGWASLGTDR